ncbi:MAG: SIS domain-containing protein [Chitinophagaceae bacterium]|nr:SIS domain-containing protein [Chitinophagaceae bacterium]
MENANSPELTATSAARYLGLSVDELTDKGAIHTAREISQQPDLWLKIWELVRSRREELGSFLEEAYKNKDLDIILTGAGTSAYIGKVLFGPYQRNTAKKTRAIATTDLLSHPGLYFDQETPVLLVSFARSGNSPESVAAVDIANAFAKKTYHLIITCNESGKLAVQADKQNAYVFLLPKEADDQSLAMTSSFTAMLLTGLLISGIKQIDALGDQVKKLAEYGANIIRQYTDKIRQVAQLDFKRAVFLGSGPLQGTAKESYLKLQELTDGQVICSYESFLGFRHGPKAVINASTLMVYLFSNNEYAHQYETDLVKAVNQGEKGLHSIGIYESNPDDLGLGLNIISSSRPGEKIQEDFLSICFVLPAQILGFFKSLQLGLQPDSPSAKGAITRVVTGVNIYQWLPQ